MNKQQWEQIRACCRDEESFRQLQNILQENNWQKNLNDYNNCSIAQSPLVAPENPVKQVDDYTTLSHVISRIRQSLCLEDIFATTVKEIRQLLEADRVAIFKFFPDKNYAHGEFIAESVVPEYRPVLRDQVEDHCFGENFVEKYQHGRYSTIPDIYHSTMSDCHIQILAKFQVQANLVVPLLCGEKIWGLLCIHQCGSPRYWSEREIDFVKLIGDNFSIAVQQSESLSQTNQELQKRKALAGVIARVRESIDLDNIFITTAKEVLQLMGADRVAIFQFQPGTNYSQGEFIAESVLPGFSSLLSVRVTDRCFGDDFAPAYALGRANVLEDIEHSELSECHLNILRKLGVKAHLVFPLLKGESLWGLLCIHQCTNPRHWTEADREFVTQIAKHLGVALIHWDNIEQMRQQTKQLVMADQQQKLLEQQKLVYTIVDKIRRSLDIDHIFKTTTDEVRSLLKADRVGVYQFFADWSGNFVAESVASGWRPLVGVLPNIEDTYLQETKGGRYRQQESFAVSNVYEAGHQDCHVALLEEFQAKAYVIVPIFQGENLWGLLGAYQNAYFRVWQTDEITLLEQIGNQFGVALQQAELLAKTQELADQLAEDLQEAQIQLVQSEKMSSLGQLVAGIAHEINNPVNFIYGNLMHVSEYNNDLLDLINLYQEEYPHPNPTIQDKIEDIDLEFLLEDLPAMINSMQVGAERIRKLVLSLRNFSRLDEAEKKPVDIHEGIESTLLILQYRLKARPDQAAIEIVREYGDLPLVECYPAQLNQVFMNIISNAIDALETTTDISIITISTDLLSMTNSQPPWAMIKISDNGPGIPDRVRSQIFDPFFTTKPVGKGTGLGLSISYKIVVEKHGGKIDCISQAGKGTKFIIKIPVHQ
jgi:GAF domain-containing protein